MALSGLEGKVAVVTGAASGLGAGSARRLAAEGVSVVVVDQNGEGAQEVAASLPGEALAVTADVSREDDVQRYMDAAVERFGRVDFHHLNAGIFGNFAPIPELPSEDFDHVIAVNLRSVFLGLRVAFQQYERQEGGGAVVVTASIAGLRGSADAVPYHTSKHGVIGLAKCAAVYGGPLGVRVNAIAPGIVPTGLLASTGNQPGGSSDWAERARIAPLRRAGTTDEIGALVAYLLSDDASFVTGEVVSIDGGANALNPVRPSGQRPPEPATAT